MNTSIKTKVNRIGLAGKIASIVLIVVMAVACFGLSIATIFFAAIPKNGVTLDTKTDYSIRISKDLLKDQFDKITDEELADANEQMKEEFASDGDRFEMVLSKTGEGITAAGTAEQNSLSASQLFPACLSALIRCAAMLVIFIFLLRLADAFRVCESPFEDGVIKRMMTFAWVLLGGAVLMGVSFSGSINGMGVFSKIGGLSYSVRFAPVVIALVVLFLASIFRYGAQLQKESDETL